MSGKYDSQKKRKSVAARSFRCGIDHGGQFADVPAGQRHGRVAGPGTILRNCRIRIGGRLGPRRVPLFDQPRRVAEQIDVPAVADAKAGPRSVAIETAARRAPSPSGVEFSSRQTSTGRSLRMSIAGIGILLQQ